MYTPKDYVEKLKEELSRYPPFTKDDVYSTFEKYVENKVNLHIAVKLGVFQFDYLQFHYLMEGTLFEEGLSLFIETYKQAFVVNPKQAEEQLNAGYKNIAKGLADYTQYCYLHPAIDSIERFDLFAKEAFQLIGDRLENSLKPYVFFLNNANRIIDGKEITQYKFGNALDALMTKNSVFYGLYKGVLSDISASQWRNIADHNDYEIKDEKVEVEYGSSTRIKKVFTRSELLLVIKTIDTLLYMHKTAFTLLSLDFHQYMDVHEIIDQKNPNTREDDRISQMVETSFAYGLEVFHFESKKQIIEIEVKSLSPWINKEDLTQYLTIVANYLNEPYHMLIRRNENVEYEVVYRDRNMKIFTYIL